jgi:hypothetical protein
MSRYMSMVRIWSIKTLVFHPAMTTSGLKTAV